MSVLFTRRGAIGGFGGSGGGGVSGTLLSDLTEGSVVYIKENGTNVGFYVAKHDYESSLNGAGRTLLVRKDCYDQRQWHSSDVNAYASSSIDSWFNSTYKTFFNTDVQTAIGTTTFYYTIGNGTNSVSTLNRAIFSLSIRELGRTATYANEEGSVLPISSVLQIAYRNGSAVSQWTRSPAVYSLGTTYVYGVDSSSAVSPGNCSTTKGSRPCFTLPSNTLFDSTTMEFIGTGGGNGSGGSTPQQPQGHTITITDEDSSNVSYVVINNVEYKTSATVNVADGTMVRLYSTKYAIVTIDGTNYPANPYYNYRVSSDIHVVLKSDIMTVTTQ